MNNYYPNYPPQPMYPAQSVYPAQSQIQPQMQQQLRPRKKYDMFGNPYYEQDESLTQYPQTQSNYQQINPQTQTINRQSQQAKISPPLMIVSDEKQARDFEIDINNVGIVHLFALKDDTAIYAKRINPSNFEAEFATYIKMAESNSDNKQTTAGVINNDTINSIDSRLGKIERFVESASIMFFNSGAAVNTSAINTEPEQTTTKRTNKKEESDSATDNTSEVS